MINYTLVPQPKIIKQQEGYFTITAEDAALIDAYNLSEKLPACILCEPAGSEAEAYSLIIETDKIIIKSASEDGCYYAVQTLRQLISQSGDGRLKCCTIEDQPDFPVRMAHLDVSRNRVPKMAELKAFIDRLASWKYNQLQLYFEHTFAYEGHEAVWRDASPFTAAEMREVNAYCAERCIELVPNQNSFGHMERWLMHENYRDIAESPDGFTDSWGIFREHSSTLAPANPGTIPFLSGLYDELLPCFDSDYLNVGGDEPWELGKGRTKELCEEIGLDRVYLNFLLKLRALAAEKGKRIQIYGDIIMKYPHLIKELPEDLVLINWGYEAAHPFNEECERIAASRIPFYVCCGVSSWNSIAGRWSNTAGNIRNGAENALRFGAEGFAVSEWGDNGHWQQSVAGLPGFLYGAAAAWNAGALDEFDAEELMSVYLFDGSRETAAAAMKLQNLWECSGVVLHNASLPAVILLDPTYPYYREDFRKFRDYDFTMELQLVDEAVSLLADLPDSRYKAELCFTAALLRHGCNLGRLQFATEGLTIDEIPLSERKFLAGELEPLISEFSHLWLLYSREGGLQENLGRFGALMEKYRGTEA